MHTFIPNAGEHIEIAARQLCLAAVDHGGAQMEFNGTTVHAVPGDVPGEVVERWQKLQHEAHQAYINSDAGKAAAVAREAEIQRLQNKHDDLMQDLARLDFTNDVAVLDWLCAMQEPSDHIGVLRRNKDVVRIFAEHGFSPNENCGDTYKPDDRENVFRYIVGQCLDGLNSVAIHGIIHKFAAEWKHQFIVAQ